MIVFGCVPQVIQKIERDSLIVLHIQSSVLEDSGIYTVTAKNDIGEDSGNINVIVQCMYPLSFDELICLVVVSVLCPSKVYCINMVFIQLSVVSVILFNLSNDCIISGTHKVTSKV